jgi:hypothetical protein
MSATAARVASEEEAKEVEDNKRKKKKKRRKSGTVLLGTLTWQVGESIIASS